MTPNPYEGMTIEELLSAMPLTKEEPDPPFRYRQGRGKAKLVCVNGKIIGDAVVVVSEDDPNWWRSMAVREKGEIRLEGGRRVRWP